MNPFKTLTRLLLVMIAILAAASIYPQSALAAPVVKLSGEGFLELSTSGPSPFVLEGTASHLGKYICSGEVVFGPGPEDGSLEGEGVAVIRAANGDLIVGVVIWYITADGDGHVEFSWRDSVELSDGTVVSSTGRFIKSRPAGAVSKVRSITDGTSNIIAILIG
jgi:hypothetical protein